LFFFAKAIEKYSEAIELVELKSLGMESAVLYSNRSAAYFENYKQTSKEDDLELALFDAKKYIIISVIL